MSKLLASLSTIFKVRFYDYITVHIVTVCTRAPPTSKECTSNKHHNEFISITKNGLTHISCIYVFA